MNEKDLPLASVIVPIYNTQSYLGRCIESILNQSYINMEIILVNDGSTDASLSVCEGYAAKDTRIHIINQSNQGALAARRNGVKFSHGKYVMFVDSDDWIEPELLETMVSTICECECSIVCTNVYIDREGTTAEKRNGIPSGIYKTGEIAKDLFYYKDTDDYGILPYNVAKLYSRDIIEEGINNIDIDIRQAEDRATLIGIIFKDINICLTDDIHYHYCSREGSACRSVNPDYLVELTAFYKYVRNIFEQHKDRDYLLRQLGKYLLQEARDAVNANLGLTTPDNPIYKEPYRLDPSAFLSQKKKIILYGAGNVGADYRKQLADCANIELCGWVDKNYKKYREQGRDVQPIEDIKETEYDYILVAVFRQTVFNDIKKELCSMGIAENTVIWGRPYGAS